ncbi:MAG: hypothetical protein WKG07_20045 [Hymenobacter sp.]
MRKAAVARTGRGRPNQPFAYVWAFNYVQPGMNRFLSWAPGCPCLAVLPLAAGAQALPRPDFAGLYRDVPRVMLDVRREGDSLRLYVRLPAALGAVGQLPRGGLGRLRRHAARCGRTACRGAAGGCAARCPGRHPRSASAWRRRGCRRAAVLQVQVGPETAADGPARRGHHRAGCPLRPSTWPGHSSLTDSVGLPLLRRYVRAGETFRVDSYGPDPASAASGATPYRPTCACRP